MTKVANIAADLDCLVVEIEQLNNLLQLYDEHREDELRGVDPEKPWTAQLFINRQDMGLALLRCIEEKAREIQDTTSIIHQKLWEVSRSATHEEE